MPSNLQERFGAGVNDETLAKLHALADGDFLDRVHQETVGNADTFPDDLFENPATEYSDEMKLLEGPEEHELLEAHNTSRSLEEPSYGEMTGPIDVPVETPDFLTERPERTHGVAPNAEALHADEEAVAPPEEPSAPETEASPEDIREAKLSELNDLVTKVLGENVMLAGGAKFSAEQVLDHFNTEDAMTDLLRECKAAGYEPELLESYAQQLSRTQPGQRDESEPTPEPAVESEPTVEPAVNTELEPQPEPEPQAEPVPAVERQRNQVKYPLLGTVKALNFGVVDDSWRITDRRPDENGVIRYELSKPNDENRLSGLTEGDLDYFQTLEVSDDQGPQSARDLAREAIDDAIASAKNKAAEIKDDFTPAAIKLREKLADTMIEGGHKAQERVQDIRDRVEKTRQWWNDGARDRLKDAFRPSVMAEKWKGALANPYLAVTVGATSRIHNFVDARREKYDAIKDVHQKEAFKRRARVAFVAGVSVYGAYRLFMTAKGLDTGHSMVDHLAQGGGHGHAAGSGETFNLSQLNNDPDVKVGDPSPEPSVFETTSPAPHVGAGTEAIAGNDFKPNPNVVDHSTTESLRGSMDTKPVLRNEGGVHWFERNGLSAKDWYNHKDDMAKRFGKFFYIDSATGDTRLNHEGMPGKELQKYLAKLKG